MNLGIKSVANRYHTRGINRSQLDGDECFRTTVRLKEEDVTEVVPENKITLDDLAKAF